MQELKPRPSFENYKLKRQLTDHNSNYFNTKNRMAKYASKERSLTEMQVESFEQAK